jgi:hypothetical protein
MPTSSPLKHRIRCILLAAVLGAPLPCGAQTYLIDFGRNDGTNGNPTPSPTDGKYWNNIATTSATVANGTVVANLVATDGSIPTNDAGAALRLQITSSTWGANGILNGGLLAPSPALLGDFAVPQATQDYFYVPKESVSGTCKISGLRADRIYQLRFFGSREATQTRVTTYSVTAGNDRWQ